MVRSEQTGFLGILMLDTKFPRPLGDIGNPETFRRLGIAVRFRTVRGASPQRIVQDVDPALLQPFVDAGRELAAQGARMISTSCGFLCSYQDQLSKAVPVPVITSSLLQCARLSHPGIVTIDAASLDDRILAAAGVPSGTPVQGVEPGCEFHRRILSNDTELDTAKAEQDVV
ncbi:MAG: aspartate/glutamate racemase family protein, partial [Longimicrobiales bacterium]